MFLIFDLEAHSNRQSAKGFWSLGLKVEVEKPPSQPPSQPPSYSFFSPLTESTESS